MADIKVKKEELEVVNGRVTIDSDTLKEELEGMNILGDSLDGEEGANAITVSITIG